MRCLADRSQCPCPHGGSAALDLHEAGTGAGQRLLEQFERIVIIEALDAAPGAALFVRQCLREAAAHEATEQDLRLELVWGILKLVFETCEALRLLIGMTGPLVILKSEICGVL